MAQNWNPETHPYRIRRIHAGGPFGWRDSILTVSTEDEALAAVAAPMGRGVIEVQAAKWNATRKGWDQLKSRRRKRRKVQ